MCAKKNWWAELQIGGQNSMQATTNSGNGMATVMSASQMMRLRKKTREVGGRGGSVPSRPSRATASMATTATTATVDYAALRDARMKSLEAEEVRVAGLGDINALPTDVLRDILLIAGVTMSYPEQHSFLHRVDSPAGVCKLWNGLLRTEVGYSTMLLTLAVQFEADTGDVENHLEGVARGLVQLDDFWLGNFWMGMSLSDVSLDDTLVRAAKLGNADIVRHLLEMRDGPRADCLGGMALVVASQFGHRDVVRLLLKHPLHAPRADAALPYAVAKGQTDVVRMLLEWPDHAPRADSDNALGIAVQEGHADTVRLLLEWPENAPRADDGDGYLLECAAWHGDDDIVRILLTRPEHAPRADGNDCEALVRAIEMNRPEVVKTLLEWPVHAARADCREGSCLVMAASNGLDGIVKILLDSHHAPRCPALRQEAVAAAARNGRGITVWFMGWGYGLYVRPTRSR